tara:strand:- start:6839 stop:7093 length:255 start_codon:yes stop_codon:yes gene_type:complete
MNVKEYKLKRPKDGYKTEKERQFNKWSGVSDWEVFFQNKKIGTVYFVGTALTEWAWDIDGSNEKGEAPTRQWALEDFILAHKNI